MEFNKKDLEQMKQLGIKPDEVKTQLARFKNGFPDLKLCSTVEINKGLEKLSPEKLEQYIALYNEKSGEKQLLKFVPASGAASRMFKMLFNYLEGSITFEDKDAKQFFNEFSNFAFSEELLSLLNEKVNKTALLEKGDKKVVELLLSEDGLNYGNLPKALLSFHRYENGTITKAIDEHLIEGALYCADASNTVRLHFTVSTEHIELIKNHLNTVVSGFEKRFNKTYNISFSVQDKATDTLAVDLQNVPFRKENDELLFRPGGHGALLKNLNEVNADVVFIKNIDNVAAEWLIQDTIEYKKALGGVLIETQNIIFDYCKQLQNGGELSATLEKEIVAFLSAKLGYKVSEKFFTLTTEEKRTFLFEKLNRPLRICGVIEASNTGGGPFWVKHDDGTESLQLVETAQINLNDKTQVEILEASLYANITDLICGLKDFKGNKFDLMQFRDPDTGFISEKSLGGKALKAMELPGLWNGAMSDWNTAFVVVPTTTFNPVKTVLDLLKKEHQGV